MALQFRNVFSVLPILLFPFQISTWTIPINISNTNELSTYPAMCQDKRGWLHVVWEDRTHGNYDIYYTFYNGTSWADTLNVSHGLTCWRPDVAVDTLNNVHVVWGDYDIGKIMWTMFDGSSWTTPVSISDDVPYFCVAPELDVSTVTNYVHCVWHNLGAADIWHSYYNGSVWSVPENITNDANDDAWADVAVDLLGRIHLVWMDYGNGSMDSIEIFYSRFDSISWTPPVNASRTVGGSVNPRIAIDNNNNPRVVWEERENGYSVYYTYFDGIEWVNPVLVDVDYSSKPNISVGGLDFPHIVWRHEDDIHYGVYDDTTLIDSITNISNTSGASAMPSIEIDSTTLHVIWYDETSGNGEIYYSKGQVSGINGPSEKENENFSFPFVVISQLRVSFSLIETCSPIIKIYDITGRKVKAVSLGKVNRGPHQYKIPLNIASGVYFLQVGAGNQRWWGKFVLLNP